MTLPDWIQFDQSKDQYHTDLKPIHCQRCGFKWYPRIDCNGYLKLNICPKCKSKLWNIPKKRPKKGQDIMKEADRLLTGED